MLSEIKLRRELNKRSQSKFSTIITIDSINSNLDKLSKYISRFFDMPIIPSYKITKKDLVSLHLSSSSNKKLQITFIVLNKMIEIGPRLTISKLIWKDA